MAVPKKRTSRSKKRIRRNVWKKKGYLVAVKAFSLAKSISTAGCSKSFFVQQKKTNTNSLRRMFQKFFCTTKKNKYKKPWNNQN